MAQNLLEAPKPKSGAKRQTYNWMTNIKISELLDYTVSNSPYRSQSSSRGSFRAGGSATSERSNKLFNRESPIATPWTHEYRGKIPDKSSRRQKPNSCSLIDVEKKLSSLVLDHTEDEIYKRHFLQADESNDSAERLTAFEDVSSAVSSGDLHELPSLSKMPLKANKTVYKPPKQLNLPSKSSKRHRFCLSKYPHSRKNKRMFYIKEADEIQHEVTVDQKGLKEAWEYYVLGKLSNETQCFINHRFDGKEKPRERLIDFLDAGYRDKDRLDYMSKRKRRLFDMSYKHDDFPGASTHL